MEHWSWLAIGESSHEDILQQGNGDKCESLDSGGGEEARGVGGDRRSPSSRSDGELPIWELYGEGDKHESTDSGGQELRDAGGDKKSSSSRSDGE